MVSSALEIKIGELLKTVNVTDATCADEFSLVPSGGVLLIEMSMRFLRCCFKGVEYPQEAQSSSAELVECNLEFIGRRLEDEEIVDKVPCSWKELYRINPKIGGMVRAFIPLNDE